MTYIQADLAALLPQPPRRAQVFGESASLAAKLSLAQLAPMLASLCLAKLVALHGAGGFSAYAIVTSLNITCFITAAGFLQSLYYVCGSALGRREPETYAATLRAGLIWAAALGVACTLFSMLAGPAATLVGVAPVLRPQIAQLGLVAGCGLLPTTLLMALRVHATMQGGAGLVTAVYVGGGMLATGLAAVLARFGAAGVLWGVAAANWLMLAAMLAGLRAPRLRLPPLFAGRAALRAALGTVFAMGWPTGAIIFLDSAASLVSVIIVARFWLPVTPLHAAVLLCISIGLVGPLGLSQAAIQRVSISHAEGDIATRDGSAWSVLFMASVYGVIAAIVLGCLGGAAGRALIGPAAAAVPPPLLRTIVTLGGVVLGCQSVIVVAASALRGLGVAKAPLVQALIGYGVVAAGSELLFSLWLKLGAAGVWWGLVLGFAATAAALLLRCAKEFGGRSPVVARQRSRPTTDDRRPTTDDFTNQETEAMSTIKLKDCQHIIEASDANLSESRFEDTRMAHVVFREMTLEGSSFNNVLLDDSSFERVSFAGVRIADCRYDGMTIDGVPVLDLLAAHRQSLTA